MHGRNNLDKAIDLLNIVLEKQINLTDQSMLEWYARLELGEKILKCVEENDECNFEAEC